MFKHYSSASGRNDLTCFLRHMPCLCCSGSLVGVDWEVTFLKTTWMVGAQPGAVGMHGGYVVSRLLEARQDLPGTITQFESQSS